jgi:hypothetical protein
MHKTFVIDVQTLDIDGGCPFTGTVSMRVKPYVERLALLKELDIKDTDQIGSSFKMVEQIYKDVEAVDLTYASTGEKLISFDDLGYYAEGVAVINALGVVLIQGPKLSGKREPQ